MAHHGFVEPEESKKGLKSHMPAVDAPFEWRDDPQDQRDQQEQS
ncbi:MULTISPECIES: hypothetical protein [Actinomadura]|uniref:Uncharacterized protein n=1 Tax=Actinomadura yumaensis TaxID=111807 RepID=A0ABW2CE17_9ACTN|nr:hypothetical protein [Actinomadura sp. J1-007]